MSELRRALALEGSFEWQGKTYKLAALTYEVLGLWEDYLEGNAWRALERARRHLSPEEHEAQARAHRADLAARAFGFIGAASLKAQEGLEGMVEMMALRLFAAEGNGLELEEARRLARTVYETSLDEWLALKAKLDGMDHDPIAPGPGPSPGGCGGSSPCAPSSAASPGVSGPGTSAA